MTLLFKLVRCLPDLYKSAKWLGSLCRSKSFDFRNFGLEQICGMKAAASSLELLVLRSLAAEQFTRAYRDIMDADPDDPPTEDRLSTPSLWY